LRDLFNQWDLLLLRFDPLLILPRQKRGALASVPTYHNLKKALNGSHIMSKKANVINFKLADVSPDIKKRMQLDSGREIVVHSDEEDDLIQIFEPEGEISMTIRMSDAGPVFTVRGAQLKLESTETITLEAKKIEIHAQEETVIGSEGGVEIDSAKKMDIHSDEDIHIEGKIIHLN